MEIPRTQQDHRRTYGRDGDRRSARTKRRADHSRLRARGWPRGVRGSGGDHRHALNRHQSATAPGRYPLTTADDVLELFGLAASQRPRAPTVGPSATAELERLPAGPASAAELSRTPGRGPGPPAAAPAELELARLPSQARGRDRAGGPPL